MPIFYDKDAYLKAINVLEEEVLLGGRSMTECAPMAGISESMLNTLRVVYFNARRDNTAQNLAVYKKRETGVPMFEAVYESLGKTVPEEILEEQRKRDAERREKCRDTWTEERKAEQAKRASDMWAKRKGQEKPKAETTPLWAQTLLLNQAKLISQLDELMDAVIPKYARDIVESNEKLDTHLVQLINKLS